MCMGQRKGRMSRGQWRSPCCCPRWKLCLARDCKVHHIIISPFAVATSTRYQHEFHWKFASYGRSKNSDEGITNVCGLEKAGVYTRVQAYLTWIQSVMKGHEEIVETGDPLCPDGFKFDKGNVPGRGFKHYDKQKLEKCANFCKEASKCCSFEWSPKRGFGFLLCLMLTFSSPGSAIWIRNASRQRINIKTLCSVSKAKVGERFPFCYPLDRRKIGKSSPLFESYTF